MLTKSTETIPSDIRISSPKTAVIKLGGTEGLNIQMICDDVVDLVQAGHQVVLVHGGSAETNTLSQELGIPPQFVTSPSGFTSRYTDRSTLEVFLMAVNGKINSLLVEALQSLGINAFGLCGLDGRLIEARRKSTIRIMVNGRQKVLRDDFTGKISRVNISLLQILLDSGCIPVIAPVAVSEMGEALNVDADRAAAAISAGLQADTLIMLTGAPGLLKSFPDESTLIQNLSPKDFDQAINYARGRMKKKILGAQEAVNGGVKKVIIADGRISSPISSALGGAGTHINIGSY